MKIPFLLLAVFALVFGVRGAPHMHEKQSEDESSEKYNDMKGRSEKVVEDIAFWRRSAQNDLCQTLRKIQNNNVAKNVILFLGDGMGIQTITAARIYKGQQEGKTGEETKLLWEEFPYTGLSKTYNVDRQIPDSAGTATAMMSGVKVQMGTLGLGPGAKYNVCDPEVVERESLGNIITWAIEEGKETGVMTNTRLTHASPASLLAHVANRNWEAEAPEKCQDIATQIVENFPGKDIKVLMGGGKRSFILKEDGGKRTDEDLLAKWIKRKEENGDSFAVLETNDELENFDSSTEYILGLFDSSHMPYEVDRDPSPAGTPSLEMMVRGAIKRLRSSPNGFVLFVEGGRIDHAHHATNAKRALEETLGLERAVRAAMELTDKEETLIVVTADHSHSLTINGYAPRGNPILGYMSADAPDARTRFDTEMPVYSDGTRQSYPTLSYANGPGFHDHYTNQTYVPWIDVATMDWNNIDYLQMATWPATDETHGGEDVAIFASGPMSHIFTGVHEQNYIAHAIGYAACIGENKEKCK